MNEEIEAELVMLKVTQGEVVQWRHDTMPYGAWRRGVAEIWDHEAECWYVRDTEGFLVRVAPVDENILPSKDGLPLTATEQLASLRDELQTLKLDHAALTDTFNEVNAAYYKVNADYNKAQEDLAKLKQELASVTQARDMATTLMHRRQAEHDEQRAEVTRLYNVESAAREEIDRLQGFLDREIANHEAADKLARKLSDELHVLRDKLAIMEGAESEEIARLRAMIKETSEIAMQRGRELEIVRAEAARHERRANSWQGAAQDALSQMEEMINNARAYAPGRG